MDSASCALKREIPVAIITATYEGQPPDNAAHFVEWLTASDSPDVKDIRFAVFGVGNSKFSILHSPRSPLIASSALTGHRGVACHVSENSNCGG